MKLTAGRFALIDPIGQGASGAVWRAFDQREARYCAVKVVKHGNAEWLPRVVREQGVRLTHPHVVSPYTWAADEDVLVAMDLLRGGSLATLVSDHGALPDHYAARLLGQLLAALDHVHAAGLLHRDVKPSNILLEATGQEPPHSRLGDFGLALPRSGPRLTEAGYVVGTRGYLSPEALEGAAPDVGRDLYAAGVVGWQMLTGSDYPPDWLVPDATPPPGVAPSLWALVVALLAAEPHGRPPDAASALRQLARIAPDLPAGQPALTRGGEPVEVFDVVGPLPAGWGPDGPERDLAPGGPAMAPAAGAGGTVAPEPAPWPAENRPASFGLALQAAGRLRPLRLALSTALVMVVAIAALLLMDATRDAPGDAGRGPGTATTAAPPQDTTPDTTAAPGTTAAPTTVPAGTRPALPGVVAGERCGWQDVGSRETAEDGRRVECVYDGREYHWEPVDDGSQ